MRSNPGKQVQGQLYRLLSIALVVVIFAVPELYAEKYGGEIFRIGAGVRNYALGGTGVTDYNSSALAYWNASLLARSVTPRFELMHSEEFMGEVTYDTFSAVWGETQRYSLVVSRIGVNNIPLTRLPNPGLPVSPDNQPYKYKTVNNADYIAYFGLYRRFGNYVIGLTPKVAYRYLAETNGFGFGADLSTHFEITERIMFGLNLRDFFTTQVLWENGTNETIKPGLDVEFSFSMPNYLLGNRMKLFAGSEIMAEGRKEAATHHLSDISFDYHFGLEIPLPEYVSLYLGYDVDNLTTGLSLTISRFQLNYGFKYNTELDNSHRISLAFYP